MIEKAGQRARSWGEPDCVVASVQTLQGKRLRSWPPGYFDLVVTDEAHHATAQSYRRIYDHLQPSWHLGVTATADRLDKKNLGGVYESLAFEYSLREAILSGYLARIQIVRCETKVDLSAIRTTGGDLNAADVEETIKPFVEELVNATIKEIGDRRSIIFTPGVGSAQAAASALESLGVFAAAISGTSRDRAEILDRFRSGEVQVLCNCNLLTEGFDAPFVEAVVLMRPTKSRSLYSQMVGRGTRLFPGKTQCLVVDFAWLTGRHKLVNPVELLATTKGPAITDPEMAGIALDLFTQGELDLMDALEIAREEAQERYRIRVEAKRKEVEYHRVAYDPFGQYSQLGFPTDPESAAALEHKPTATQLDILARAGIPDAHLMSRSRASYYVKKISDRRVKGLATLKQVKFMMALGLPSREAEAVMFRDAGPQIQRLQARKRARRVQSIHHQGRGIADGQ